jgi:hypothetical protein
MEGISVREDVSQESVDANSVLDSKNVQHDERTAQWDIEERTIKKPKSYNGLNEGKKQTKPPSWLQKVINGEQFFLSLFSSICAENITRAKQSHSRDA